jgi:hypothetical protein
MRRPLEGLDFRHEELDGGAGRERYEHYFLCAPVEADDRADAAVRDADAVAIGNASYVDERR